MHAILIGVEKFPAHTPRPEGEHTSELPEKARAELRQTLARVLANDVAEREAETKAQRAKKG
ncbi:hypothetical protein JNK62_00305 [bacterium]|nr:hypothetical protein [bacterium]